MFCLFVCVLFVSKDTRQHKINIYSIFYLSSFSIVQHTMAWNNCHACSLLMELKMIYEHSWQPNPYLDSHTCVVNIPVPTEVPMQPLSIFVCHVVCICMSCMSCMYTYRMYTGSRYTPSLQTFIIIKLQTRTK